MSNTGRHPRSDLDHDTPTDHTPPDVHALRSDESRVEQHVHIGDAHRQSAGGDASSTTHPPVPPASSPARWAAAIALAIGLGGGATAVEALHPPTGVVTRAEYEETRTRIAVLEADAIRRVRWEQHVDDDLKALVGDVSEIKDLIKHRR